jgi:chemotaxis regulatin CheY-phosphate phosphatase CheZ
MTNQEAIDNLRELGRIFADSIKSVTGKEVNTESDLSNGLVAYEYLDLKGKWDYIDKSVDKVLRIMYKEFIERHGD